MTKSDIFMSLSFCKALSSKTSPILNVKKYICLFVNSTTTILVFGQKAKKMYFIQQHPSLSLLPQFKTVCQEAYGDKWSKLKITFTVNHQLFIGVLVRGTTKNKILPLLYLLPPLVQDFQLQQKINIYILVFVDKNALIIFFLI